VHLRPPRREDARRAFEGVHFEPRVVGERWLAGPFREITRFGDRVLGEARAALEIALVRQALQEAILREIEPKGKTSEQIAYLPDLPLVPGGDEELRGRRER